MGNASIEITKKTPELSGTLGSLFYTKKEMITCRIIISFFLVHEKGLEPSRRLALVPKTSVSTNSTTRA